MKRNRKHLIASGLCIGLLCISFLLTACGDAGSAEGNDKAEAGAAETENGDTVSQEGEAQGEKELEDFSMPMKEEVKLDGPDFANVEIAKEQMGFTFESIEEFANGYRFIWLEVPDENTLILTYEKDGGRVEVVVTPELLEYEAVEKQYRNDLEFEGITVKRYLMVQFFIPNREDWMDLLTEEEKQFFEEGIAGTGCDNEQKEVERYDQNRYLWQQGETEWICIRNSINNHAPQEDLEAMVEEWIAANVQ